jgi:hypothetical protein
LAAMHRNALELSDAFARVVQKRREATKLSRAALAEKAGLHQTYIGLLERGHRLTFIPRNFFLQWSVVGQFEKIGCLPLWK